jgi:hypothetical protein
VNYRNHKIETENRNLLDFIRQLAEGKFLIPTFQRQFVWEPGDIVSLWDSLYRRYPIGSILCWNTTIRLHVHRKIGGFFVPEHGGEGAGHHVYILDGQQRSTSLVASFYGGAGRVKEHYDVDHTVHFDLTRGEFFLEKDYFRHRWESDPAFLFPVREAPGLPDDYGAGLEGLKGYSRKVAEHFAQLKYMFAEYPVPLIHLRGFNVADVCAIFERMNQSGKRLENLDILIARGFRNYATVVEEDFPVS